LWDNFPSPWIQKTLFLRSQHENLLARKSWPSAVEGPPFLRYTENMSLLPDCRNLLRGPHKFIMRRLNFMYVVWGNVQRHNSIFTYSINITNVLFVYDERPSSIKRTDYCLGGFTHGTKWFINSTKISACFSSFGWQVAYVPGGEPSRSSSFILCPGNIKKGGT